MPRYTAILLFTSPAKDFYDKAPVWINLALAIVGVIGIGIAVGTLYYVGQQVKEATQAVATRRRTSVSSPSDR